MSTIFKCMMTQTLTFNMRADSWDQAQDWCQTHDFEHVKNASENWEVDYSDAVEEIEAASADEVAVNISKEDDNE